MKKLLTTLLLFTLCFDAIAQDDKTVSLTVTGQGKTIEEAKQNALRSAIEQAFGTFISSNTTILNDKLIKDEIVSVTNGNIQKYDVLNETPLPDGSYTTLLKAIVSVNKLTNFCESKGVVVEFKGGLFAMNIKQQLLNESGEINAITEMVGILHENFQKSFKYELLSGEPKSLDAESKNWEIPMSVKAIANLNNDFCANYCIQILSDIALKEGELENYRNLNKKIFPVIITYNAKKYKFYLRKKNSREALNFLAESWGYYTKLFSVNSGIDTLYSPGDQESYEFDDRRNVWRYRNEGIIDNEDINLLALNFVRDGDIASTITWNDKRTLKQIEKIEKYQIEPLGIMSHYRYGGIVMYVDENGHGFVRTPFALDVPPNEDPKIVCDNFEINGYRDWRIPKRSELEFILSEEYYYGIGGGRLYEHKYSYNDENKVGSKFASRIIVKDPNSVLKKFSKIEFTYYDYISKDGSKVLPVRAF